MNSMTLRVWHSYLGFFIAPSVIFFALTGAIQLFSLHEAHGDYHPPALLEKLGSVHKDQVLEPHHEHEAEEPPKAADGAAPVHHDDDDKVATSTLLLKWFFLVVALGLATSTILGLCIGLSQSRRKRQNILILIAGIVIPVALVLI